jgi:hypothetical protein
MSERQEILESLQPLFDQADRYGLWLHCNYQDMWFHPDELRDYHKKDQFLWSPANWQLRDPDEKLLELLNRKKSIENEIEQFKLRLMR